jgi:YfiH family protein
VDDILASIGLTHGTRASRANSWEKGARKPVGKKKKLAAETKKPSEKTVALDRSPALSKFENVVHGFSTRSGGVTRVYRPGLPKSQGDLNLGFTSHDERANVEENRARLMRAVTGKEAKNWKLVTLSQRHTPIVRVLRDENTTQMRGDAVMTQVPLRMLAVLTADCIPVLLYDKKNRAVAAFHAGWRGTLARIVERGVGSMRLEFGTTPKDIVAAIGPGIGPCCYSVGEEVRSEFLSQFAYSDALFSDVYESDPIRDKYPLLFLTARAPGHSPIGPQLHLDLWEANRRQLLDAGVPAKNISVSGACTACGIARFFSHRTEQGFTGRMMSVIGLKK